MGWVSGIKTAAHIVTLFFIFRLAGSNIVLMKRIYQNQQLENE
jgi:hypothetical protein